MMIAPRTISASAQNDQMFSVKGNQPWLQRKMKIPTKITTRPNAKPPSEMLRTGPQDTRATSVPEAGGGT